jgi:hypothetical protein
MTDRVPLHILMTLNCDPPGSKGSIESPRTWELSSRAIEGFSTRVIRAGYVPTLFVAPQCVEEHDPLLEELARRGAEIGLYLHPPQIGDGRFGKSLGQYNADDQRALIDYGAERFADVLGSRPRSFRSGHFSASDVTYRQLFELGFRQGSLAEPGRQVAIREAVWLGKPHDPHYVDPDQKLQAGTMPFLEVPITTDLEGEVAHGVPFTLQIDAGPINTLLQPTIERSLARMQREDVAFRVLCFYTSNRFDYYDETNPQTQKLEALLDELEALDEQYELIPLTLSGAHERYRMLMRTVNNA